MVPFIRLGLSFAEASEILRVHGTKCDVHGIARMVTEPVPCQFFEGDATHLYIELCAADPSRPYRIDRPELTSDMAENIVRYFEPMQRLGRLMVESNQLGLWFVGPTNRRLFIGLARLPDRPVQPDIVPAGTPTSAGALCKLH